MQFSILLSPVLLVFTISLHCSRAEPLSWRKENVNSSDRNTHSMNSNQAELQQIHILFRHGDRAPIRRMFDNSTPVEILWPIGIGQLTASGIRQEFLLGRWLREQYNSFIPGRYNASDIYVRATETDRTIMSGQSFLAGLYNCIDPGRCPLMPMGIAWRPIPVHTVSSNDDIEFLAAGCRREKKLWDEQIASVEMKEYMQRHQDLVYLLEKKTNYRPITSRRIYEIGDVLYCMKSINATLPEWCTAERFKEIMDIRQFYWKTMLLTSHEGLQLHAGIFLKKMSDTLTAATRRSSPYEESEVKRLMVYSAHDVNVDQLRSILKQYDDKIVDYAGAVILELFGPKPPGKPDEYYMRFRYKAGWRDSVGDYFQIPPCAQKPAKEGCRLDQFMEYLKPFCLTKNEYVERCKLTDGSGKPFLSKWVIMMGALALLSYRW
ncbi:unnamed protein product [Calicophoron daubneyi]|uniref:acid phosphatase n=1 Tax=Calicophoron daubneyi TaxID=300641 RepID=A0AAV2T243_CALDB